MTDMAGIGARVGARARQRLVHGGAGALRPTPAPAPPRSGPITQSVAPPLAQIQPIGDDATGGAGFNQFAVGAKQYGAGGIGAAQSGPITDLSGYQERDLRAAARNQAIVNMLKQRGGMGYTQPINPAGGTI